MKYFNEIYRGYSMFDVEYDIHFTSETGFWFSWVQAGVKIWQNPV